MSVKFTITGKKRLRERKRLFRPSLLVLQIEVHKIGYEPDGWGFGRTFDNLIWRDATLLDLPTGELIYQKGPAQ